MRMAFRFTFFCANRREARGEPITEEDTGDDVGDTSFYGNDFSLGGDDDVVDASGCG
jgi:hypothetical protein